MTFADIADQFDVPTNRLYGLRDALLAKKTPVIDLISGNVNEQGIHFPADILREAMAVGLKASKTYHPDPLGQPAARRAISGFYRSEDIQIPESQIVLTPGTSISYWYAFKLLANAGDDILCPTPSYPLFEAIAGFCGIKLRAYPLREEKRWAIDFERLESAVTPRTKAVILISPHNPTGAVASREEVQSLADVAARKGLAIISDEVFSPFLFELQHLPRPANTSAPLVITLNGLSKMLALPGVKIGWMAVTGDPSLVQKSLKALTMISDTFLPVSEAAQWALPRILKRSNPFLRSYAATIQERMMTAVKCLADQKKMSFVKPEGGFFMTLRLEEKGADEEALAYRLLQKQAVLVHPGYFYDMQDSHIVLTFVSTPLLLRKGLQALISEAC